MKMRAYSISALAVGCVVLLAVAMFLPRSNVEGSPRIDPIPISPANPEPDAYPPPDPEQELFIYLPQIVHHPPPTTPILNPIDSYNEDGDNTIDRDPADRAEAR